MTSTLQRAGGHAIPGVAGVYDRHQYFEEKGQALAKLAELVEQIVSEPAAARATRRRR